MKSEPIIRIRERDFDRARIEILRELTGFEGPEQAPAAPQPTTPATRASAWSVTAGALALS